MPPPFPLPAYIKTRHRHTLTTIKSILDFILSLFSKMNPTPPETQSSPSPPSPPPFDPAQPSVPISYPLKTLEELESRAYFDSFHYPFNKAKVKLQSSSNDAPPLPNRPRILVCHDMAGGYTDDKWIQGGNNPDAYAIWHWYLMDVFVYFSHNLVTLPPPCWTNAAHKHGVKVLGTFIMEWDEGAIIANKLLSTYESARMYAEHLAELARALGFDGWLINMEIEVKQVPILKDFLSYFTQTMHSCVPGSLIIWYDSVTTSGHLDWQNLLNSSNKPFFDVCDGIFVNYTWKEEYPKLSAELAGDRKLDVYMGIDVFGRGTFGGGQWTTNVALDVIRNNDVSAAIFAPGWVYENHDKKEFQILQNRWWELVEKSWGIVQKYPRVLPFYSNFDQGRGLHFSLDGKQISDAPWNNISSQSFQPFLEFTEDENPDTLQCFIDFKEASYGGGGNITIKGTLQKDACFTTRLFEGELRLGNSPINFTYSVKSIGGSLLGLVLDFSSATKEKKTVLLASDGNTLLIMNRFSHQFSNVIMPRQFTKPEKEPGWTTNEFSIAIQGTVLTKISALCYKLEYEVNEHQVKPESSSQHFLLAGGSEYYAALGHMMINASAENLHFPPSTSWVVEGQYIKWSSDSEGSNNLSLKFIWTLENGNTDLFPKYNIYVKKLPNSAIEKPSEVTEGAEEYLGVAEVEAFYVSDLTVPSGTSALKFIIQVCDLNGACQKLEESPFLQLKVEDS